MKKISHQILNLIIFLAILLSRIEWHPTLAIAREYTFTTIDVPGAVNSWAYGIDGNNIVGYYVDANGFHGFLASPGVKPITVDIRLGVYSNCFKQNEKGLIPVAICGSADLDVTQIDIGTLSLRGLSVKIAGESNKYLAHYEYVNDDNYLDLVVQFQDSDGWIASGNGYTTLTGKLNNGTPIEGKETICIIP